MASVCKALHLWTTEPFWKAEHRQRLHPAGIRRALSLPVQKWWDQWTMLHSWEEGIPALEWMPTCHFAAFQTAMTGVTVLLEKCRMMWSYFKTCFAFHWFELKSSDFYLFLVYISEKSACPFELSLYLCIDISWSPIFCWERCRRASAG